MFPENILTISSFMKPNYYAPSAWIGHAAFAFWLIEQQKPRRIVELGTHHGFSYFCFCQAVKTLKLQTECVAIDTWQGDEHSGFYDENVFISFEAYNKSNYNQFSRILRAKFDVAVESFPDSSIDILHIDGRHFYEDVKYDYKTWKKKLSSNSIVLFHDIEVTTNNFGVKKFWNELKIKHPHFEFLHSSGLGVLCVSENDLVRSLPIFRALSDEKIYAIRSVYEKLGNLHSSRHNLTRNTLCPCGSNKKVKHCHGKFN